MTLQRSALHPVAASSGAQFEASEGWDLPKAYTDAAAEYAALTTSAAVYDNSHLGRLKATGEDGLDLINRLSTNKVVDLEPGQGAPTILTTDRGRILDLIGVVNVDDYVLLLTSPGAQQQVIDWLDRYTIMEDLVVEDITSQDTMLSVLGPESAAILSPIRRLSNWMDSSPYHSILARIADHEVRIISRPLGELPNFDLLVSHDAAASVWESPGYLGRHPCGRRCFPSHADGLRGTCAGPGTRRLLQPLGSGPDRVDRLRQGLLHRPGGHRPTGHLSKSAETLGAAEVLGRCSGLPRGPAAE